MTFSFFYFTIRSSNIHVVMGKKNLEYSSSEKYHRQKSIDNLITLDIIRNAWNVKLNENLNYV